MADVRLKWRCLIKNRICEPVSRFLINQQNTKFLFFTATLPPHVYIFPKVSCIWMIAGLLSKRDFNFKKAIYSKLTANRESFSNSEYFPGASTIFA
jgi:hypothetical protein